MSLNQDALGESVYIQSDITQRAANPLYSAVNDLVQRHSTTRQVLDIGCSDGVATYNLPAEYTVFGADLSHSALMANANQIAARTDMRNLPIKPGSGIDTVLFLDVLEHEPWTDSVKVLESVKEFAEEDHSVIVSMPIISGLSLETWRGLLQIARDRKRPEMGLFDRTHQILKGVKSHLKLFAEAGYEATETYTTNHLEGVTGIWSFKSHAEPQDRAEIGDRQGIARIAKVAQLALRPVEGGRRYLLYNETQRANHPRISKLGRSLVAFQGLYLLKPSQRAE